MKDPVIPEFYEELEKRIDQLVRRRGCTYQDAATVVSLVALAQVREELLAAIQGLEKRLAKLEGN